MKILIVEDDNSLRELMHKALAGDGHIVETAAKAKTAMMKAEIYDFIYAQMKNLRKRLAEAQADIEIKTVHGYGYKLNRP